MVDIPKLNTYYLIKNERVNGHVRDNPTHTHPQTKKKKMKAK